MDARDLPGRAGDGVVFQDLLLLDPPRPWLGRRLLLRAAGSSRRNIAQT
jgi:hypothetical protein